MRNLVAVLSSLLCCSLASAQGAASGLTRIGAAAAVHGLIKATAPGQVGRIVSSGKPLYLNDRVTSDAAGKLQVMLLDETVFTLGPNADMVLDEFVYDPNTSAGKVTATITKGAFRFVTGRLARQNPGNMKVKLGVGTIGIRGTVVMGETGPGGSTVINVGAGSGNNAGEPPSALYVENAGTTVEIEQSGQGTTVSPNQPPAPPTDMSQQINALSQGLESGPSGSGGSSGAGPEEDGSSATQDSGQDAAAGGAYVTTIEEDQEDSQSYDDSLTKAVQDAEEEAGLLTSWDQMRQGTLSGVAGYGASGALTVLQVANGPCSVSCTGSWDFIVNVDFDLRSVSYSLGLSSLYFSDGAGGGLNFSSLEGAAAFDVPTISGNSTFAFQFLNEGGETAGALQGNVTYSDTTGNVGEGDTLTAPKGPEIGL